LGLDEKADDVDGGELVAKIVAGGCCYRWAMAMMVGVRRSVALLFEQLKFDIVREVASCLFCMD
jgi:hypothetical protein